MLKNREVPTDKAVSSSNTKDYSKTTYGRLEGIILRLVAICFFALMQILTKSLYLHSSISSLETIYFRGLIMLLIDYLYSKYISLDLLDIPKQQVKPMCYRSLTGTIGNMLFFTSTKLFPLSLVSALSYLSPIMTAGLSFLFLNETLTKFDVGSMLFAFCGVIIIIFNPYKNASISAFYDIKWWYYICPLLNPIFAATGTLLMRYMGETIHCVVAPTYLAVFICAFTPILAFGALSFRDMATKYDTIVLIHLLGMGFTATMGQVLTSRALQIEKAGRVQAFNYLTIVIMVAADVLIFGIPLHWLDLIGICIILGANFSLATLKACGVIKN